MAVSILFSIVRASSLIVYEMYSTTQILSTRYVVVAPTLASVLLNVIAHLDPRRLALE